MNTKNWGLYTYTKSRSSNIYDLLLNILVLASNSTIRTRAVIPQNRLNFLNKSSHLVVNLLQLSVNFVCGLECHSFQWSTEHMLY
jgi:hypothetical protein